MKYKHLLIPLGFAAVVALVWILTSKKNQTGVVVASNPAAQPGINAGFAAPPVATGNPTDLTSVHIAQSQPDTAASGVPPYSAQAQATNRGRYIPLPSPTSSLLPQFFSTVPRQQPTAAPADNGNGGCGCGCGGCSKKSACDSCPSSSSKFIDGRGACLAMDKRRQIAFVPQKYWRNMQVQIANTAPMSYEDILARQQYDFSESHGGVPAAPAISHVYSNAGN